ncbi:MAG: tetratricopeptide repeat protein [Bacteroidales bacterium]|nr:tetratricopeptide repeat protein [Bacteroidales bacterium]
MEGNDIDINALIKRYELMRYEGKSIYFDPDDFAVLADYYNDFGDISEAKYIVKIGLDMHPGSTQLMVVKAKILVAYEKYQDAYDYLVIIGEDESSVDYLQVKIECLLYLDKVDEANAIVDKTVTTGDLDEIELYMFLSEVGYLYNDVDIYDKAVSLQEEALKIDNSDVELLADLSYGYEMLSDFKKAAEINNLILDINPYSFDSWVNLGKLHSMLQEYDKAIEAFDFALTINEDEVSVMKMKALTLYLNDNVEAAVDIFRECLKNSPDDESLYDSLLEGYEVMEQYAEMLKVIALKEEKFGNKGVLLKRAHVYLTQERYEEAEKVFKELPASDKNNYDYYVLEGELAIYNEDYDTAEMAYMLAMIDSPDDELVIDKLANISIQQDKYEKSAEHLEHLLLLNPDYPTAKARLAFLRFEIGAKEPFDEIMSQFTDDELRALLSLLSSYDIDYSEYNRKQLLTRLNEARENRVLFKNIKY